MDIPGLVMTDLPSHLRDRAETKTAKAADRERNAKEVWTQVEAEQRAREEKTKRLKALRLAQETKL
jgi:hypothetical protein